MGWNTKEGMTAEAEEKAQGWELSPPGYANLMGAESFSKAVGDLGHFDWPMLAEKKELTVLGVICQDD